jgi:hypothetical protein
MSTVEIRKTTVNFPPIVASKLVRLADRLHLTQTQVLRESIELRYRLQKEIDSGGTLLIERKNGDRVELLLTGSDE